MDIKLKEISIRDLSNAYEDNLEDGVIGYRRIRFRHISKPCSYK